MGKTLRPDPFLIFAAEALQERLSALDTALTKVRKRGDVQAVHQARVASRRLRSGLSLLEAAYGRKHFVRWRRQVSDITGALGDLRDTDVQLLLIGERVQAAAGAADGRTGLERLQKRLKRRRKAQYRQVRRKIVRLRRKETLAEMAAAWQWWQDDSGVGGAMDPVVRDQARSLLLAQLQATEALNAPLPEASQSAALHGRRIALKRLRYTLEIVAPIFAGQLEEFIATLKELQVLLGEHHDADVWTRRLPKILAKQHKRLRRENASADAEAQVLADLNAFLEDRQRHRSQCYEQVRQRWEEIQRQDLWERLTSLLTPARATAPNLEPKPVRSSPTIPTLT